MKVLKWCSQSHFTNTDTLHLKSLTQSVSFSPFFHPTPPFLLPVSLSLCPPFWSVRSASGPDRSNWFHSIVYCWQLARVGAALCPRSAAVTGPQWPRGSASLITHSHTHTQRDRKGERKESKQQSKKKHLALI